MAVSGRKILDLNSSVSRGSAEDFEHSCAPCLSEGQDIEARKFCVECQEYLCQTCLQCHRKTRASKTHKLIDVDEIEQHVSTSKASDVCTEICSTHKNEVIKFFCPTHEKLGCTDCMTLTHRSCTLEYIPEKCLGISDSKEFQYTLKNLDQKLKEADTVMIRAEDKNEEIDAWYEDVIKDIVKVRKEINDHLDIIQKKIEKEAKQRKTTDKHEVKTILELYTNFIADMRKLQSDLKDLKEQKKSSEVFIAVKRAKSKLQSEEMGVDTVLDKDTKLLFECSKALESILSIDCFGKLTEHKTNVITNPNMQTSPTKPITPPSGKYPFSSLSHKADIDIKTKADSKYLDITGCAVISSDKLILADYWNKKLKVVNTLTKAVVEENQLDTSPYDVTVLPDDHIAVTMPEKKEIMVMRTTGQLSTSRSIKVQGKCLGITYNQDRLYVLCQDPNCVLILDMKGKVKNTMSLKDKTVFKYPCYIEVSKDNELLYISDYDSSSVVNVTLQGEISAVHKGISVPQGMVMLDDGSLLVCSFNTGSIYRLQANLKQSCKLVSGLNRPRLICCSTEKCEVYVGGFYSDLLKVLSLQ